jgi:hypothetical protein
MIWLKTKHKVPLEFSKEMESVFLEIIQTNTKARTYSVISCGGEILNYFLGNVKNL